MACGKKIHTTLKPPTVSGGLPTILSHFYIGDDGQPVPVEDFSTLGQCPEVTTDYLPECFNIVGEEPIVCRSGKCIIRTTFDCSLPEGEQYASTVEGIINPETGETLPIGTADGEAIIVPCPEITTISGDYCTVGGGK